MKIMTQIFQNEELKKDEMQQIGLILKNSLVLRVSRFFSHPDFKIFFYFVMFIKNFSRSTLAEDNFLYNLKLVRCLICP